MASALRRRRRLGVHRRRLGVQLDEAGAIREAPGGKEGRRAGTDRAAGNRAGKDRAAGNRAGTEGSAGNRGRPPTKLAIDAIWEGNGES